MAQVLSISLWLFLAFHQSISSPFYLIMMNPVSLKCFRNNSSPWLQCYQILSNPTLLRNMLKILPKTVQDQATAAGATQLKQVFHEEAMVRSLFTIILFINNIWSFFLILKLLNDLKFQLVGLLFWSGV